MSEENQIIIIKKKGGHGGHHGGAWKVAYADFVTAMMALFIVLWLLNTSKPTQEAIAGYFRDPSGTGAKKGSALGGAGDASALKQEDMSKLKQQLIESLQKMANFDKLKDHIEITVTPEGLHIELLDDAKGMFFETGKAEPTPVLGDLLRILASETGKLPNPVSIEGHTDAKPYSRSGIYSNWELSTDRANMARRLMEESGLHPHQVVQVRGFADNNLRDPEHPQEATNRRVTVIVQYTAKPGQSDPGIVFDGKLSAGAVAPPAAAEKPSAEKPGGGEAPREK